MLVSHKKFAEGWIVIILNLKINLGQTNILQLLYIPVNGDDIFL